MFPTMYHNNNFCYTEASLTPYYVYSSFTQMYHVNGSSNAPTEQCYSSYDHQQPVQYPVANQAGFPTLPLEAQVVFPIQDTQPYGFASDAAESLYIADGSEYANNLMESQYSDSNLYTTNDTTLLSNIGDITIPYMEDEDFYPGILAPSHQKGREPVLLYRIPKTDLCYVYILFTGTNGEKTTYICKECCLLNKFVPSEVTNLCYFVEDPIRAGHICYPQRFRKEMEARKAVMAPYRSGGDDSGLGDSFN
uniref:YTH domain-containing protein n=1 Tax=Haemonchus contortus TaxID=6289 RepID=A0A7I4XY05_HAECO